MRKFLDRIVWTFIWILHKIPIFCCQLCEYTCKYENIFKDHLDTLRREKPFSCNECGYGTDMEYCLNKAYENA